jgi:hypothetical protein
MPAIIGLAWSSVMATSLLAFHHLRRLFPVEGLGFPVNSSPFSLNNNPRDAR